jgi:hypothetical protein
MQKCSGGVKPPPTTFCRENKAQKTVFVDVMLDGRFVFTHRHRYCPLFRLDLKQIYTEVMEKRPSLKGKNIEMWID